MQAIEATGTIDAYGQLALDQPLPVAHPGRVRIIVLLTDLASPIPEQTQPPIISSQSLAENQPSHKRPIWERVAEISAQVPPEEWAKLPKDLSKNVDHYLYGSPKEDE
ncbi:hypothetical protein [Stenomitos frigidus]|uniref:Uncharacterized protein n=1 Tax=Stenomitos frigidus ULC18 TaxID=2107698 RepID=A0A2T1DW05_9CYAN|nr:hypothetical protein [Stenomitos frigidus]PSB24621.1 hypothetical protein C7B82_26750 [Stenomitos frigidus ULC18]